MRQLPASLPDGLTFEPIDADPRSLEVIATVLASSEDPADRTTVAALGSTEAARTRLAAAPGRGCSHEPSWWVLLTVRGVPAGFVLPVTYDDTVRDGTAMSTIFHMGVVPASRGVGLARHLLRRATRTLCDHGTWRIFCDTWAGNAAMIRTFEAEGWTRLADRTVPVPQSYVRDDLS